MVSNKLKKPMMWLITINSKEELSDMDKEFVAELVSEEARKTKELYGFIVHEILESKTYSKILIEGEKIAIKNLLSVLKDNLPYKISYKKLVL